MPLVKVSQAVRDELVALQGAGRKDEARALAVSHGLTPYYGAVLLGRKEWCHTPKVRKKWARASAVGSVIA
jgi:hypothetical protein